MSDPRLTAERMAELNRLLRHETSSGWWNDVCRTVGDSHETLRADITRLTAENAALREERDEASRVSAVLVNNAINDPLTVDYAQRIIRMERELAEAKAERDALEQQRQEAATMATELRAMLDDLVKDCRPAAIEDWRGANEDWRKEK